MFQMDKDKELQIIMDKLETLPRHQRMSFLEHGVEELVGKVRDSLNKELIDKINKKVSDSEPIYCPEGHTSYSKGVKKKSFS